MNFKKGDNIIVIAGKDKGKKGQITEVLRRDDKVIIDGINMRKRHQKPRKQGQSGQVVEFAAPIHASNVMMEDPKTKKPTRIGIKRVGKKRIRIAKKSDTEIS